MNNEHKDHLVLELYEAFDALENALPAAEMSADDLADFLRDIEPLTDAVKRNDWNLIANAVQMHAKPTSDEMRVSILVRIVARRIWRKPKEYGLSARATKADILEVLRKDYPHLHKTLPTSKRGLTDWWKKVGFRIEQARGYGRDDQS